MQPVKNSPFKPINPTGAMLNIEKLRTFPGFEHCPDEEAKEIVDSLSTLASFLVQRVNKYSHSEKSQEIGLEPNLQQGKAA
ncbi:MAG: hypothetical protein JST06_07075 [Bacteroidetes bacterium]|nr:hypothetical protein [Bacteroidota bacterium]